ncbi:hypothetical protein [Streptomyces sp. SGAir0957]
MTDDHLARIDEVLHDYTVSGDAMRSRPAPEGERQADGCSVVGGWIDEAVAGPTEVWIAPAGTDLRGDGWERLDCVASVDFGEITLDPATIDPTAGQPSAATWNDLQAAIERIEEARAMRAAIILELVNRAIGRLAERYGGADTFRHTPEAEGCDDCGDPVQPPVRPSPRLPRRDGRPEWQSPYGPARRRR